MKIFSVMLLAVGLIVASANADTVVFSGATYDMSISDPVPVGDGSEDLLAIVLTATNTTGDAGYDASAFDGGTTIPPDPDPISTYTGITGTLHQHYSATFEPPPLATSLLDSTEYATVIDTHFLFVLADLLIVAVPEEDVTLATSAEPTDAPAPFDAFADTDFGAYLMGVFAVTAVPTMDLAYIVVPDGSYVTLDFFLSGTKGGEDISTTFIVPEPATLGLLAIGALGALIRRRRS